MNANFASLFRKYRLRSEFETLGEFANALAEQGRIYDESLFSHWQKGTRVPHDRRILIEITKIFIQRKGIQTLKEANEFMSAAGQGYFTDEEIRNLKLSTFQTAPFQVPREVPHFVGRKTYLAILKKILRKGKIVLICGQAGIGKTALAIKLGHMLRDDFPDGVLWFKSDSTHFKDILLSIGYSLGEDVSNIKDIQNRISTIRSLIAYKKVLFIFDNLEKQTLINSLVPSTSESAVILTSRYKQIDHLEPDVIVPLSVFNKSENFQLLTEIVKFTYLKKNQEQLLTLSNSVGNLPLAMQIVLKQLIHKSMQLPVLVENLSKRNLDLSVFTYENKNLLASLEISFGNLTKIEREIFVSLAMFEGADFSTAAIAFIHDLSLIQTRQILEELVNCSLVEYSFSDRFRLHPVIKIFAKEKFNRPELYKKLGTFYTKYLDTQDKGKITFFHQVQQEYDNIMRTIDQCIQHQYWDVVFNLWDLFSPTLWDTGRWNEIVAIGQIIHKAAQRLNNQRIIIICSIRELSWVYFWQGKVKKTERLMQQGLKLAVDLDEEYLVAYAKERLGKVAQVTQQYTLSLQLLNSSLLTFKKLKERKRIGNILRMLGETHLLLGNYTQAEKLLFEGITVLRQVRDLRYRSIYSGKIYTNLGILFYVKKQYRLSKNYFTLSLDIDKHIGSRTYIHAWNYYGLGLIYEKSGNHVLAQEYKDLFQKETKNLEIDKKTQRTSILLLLTRRKNNPVN